MVTCFFLTFSGTIINSTQQLTVVDEDLPAVLDNLQINVPSWVFEKQLLFLQICGIVIDLGKQAMV